jgi:hypothetical protein
MREIPSPQLGFNQAAHCPSLQQQKTEKDRPRQDGRPRTPRAECNRKEDTTMRAFYSITLIAALACGSALAQPATQQSLRTPQKPVDHGPFTPEASSAYQGGGVILQGVPGAPQPTPQPTPPGQTPANMVKP